MTADLIGYVLSGLLILAWFCWREYRHAKPKELCVHPDDWTRILSFLPTTPPDPTGNPATLAGIPVVKGPDLP